ncbi:pectinesterase-like [Oryza brachyantha]|uniref:pectinesterase-like n=1 Tax=Oryza brachyantha TaxID=4533 RepID=UPI001ADD19C2|nr:pectinesterase-like [Oryza brachyantha]
MGHPTARLRLAFLLCFLLPLSGCRGRAHAAAFPASALVAEAVERHHRLRIALNATAVHVGKALDALTGAAVAPASGVTPLSAGYTSPLAATAHDDCAELLEDSLDLLAGAGEPGAAHDDALTWLSAALTNHDTCADSLEEAGIAADAVATPHLAAARAMVSDCLAMYAEAASATLSANSKDGLGGVPVWNGANGKGKSKKQRKRSFFPRWLTARDRRLLLGPAEPLVENADLVVAKDGTGTHRTISDAVKAAPERSERRTVIHVKAGRYDENVKVGRKKTNLVFVGDGKGVTVVSGGRSVADNYTTFHTATFAASGRGFMMRDMTVENWAGPAKHQAVALRVSADRAAVYRCNVVGYQDTLYAHSNRQFYRDCDVYGTVDFVFGNAAAVLQRCNLWARAPLPGQKNTVTAQNRRDPGQSTGIVIHACRVVPAPDLAPPPPPPASPAPAVAPAEALAPTYLGRPWKLYSRVVVMMSYIAGHIPPEGWLAWNATFALDTLYYGEYMNYGPGAGVAGRVAWPGHRVINDSAEAERFTVARFISGASWLPATGVSFLSGLSL